MQRDRKRGKDGRFTASKKTAIKKAVKKAPKLAKKTVKKTAIKFKSAYTGLKTHVILKTAKAALASTRLAQTGNQTISGNPKDKYSTTIKYAIANNKLEKNTLDKVADVLYGARHQLRDHFAAKLYIIRTTDQAQMGECELFGVLAEDVREAFKDLIGQTFDSGGLKTALDQRCGFLQSNGRLRSFQTVQTDKGRVGDVMMNYSFA